MASVGIPGCLMYYRYFPMWKAFFEGLGAQVVVSGPTNRQIMDAGVASCVDEACLAVKVCFGHVMNLRDRADCLFIPRLTSLSRNEYVCPKLGGLPDMIRNGIDGLPPVIDTEINLRKDANGLFRAAEEIGARLQVPRRRIRSAYAESLLCLREYEKHLRAGLYPADILGKGTGARRTGGLRVAVIGHCYNLYDGYVNMDLLKKLERENISVRTIEMMDPAELTLRASEIPKRMFWYFGRLAVGAALSLMESGDVDGILYLLSFGCGIDSFVCDYVERLVRNRSGIPFAVLTIDEHTGEAGLDTRIEAFADMIRWRHAHEADFSAHGQYVYRGQGAV